MKASTNSRMLSEAVLFLLLAALTLAVLSAQQPDGGAPATESAKKASRRPPRPGVSTPGVRREMSTITPVAVFTTGGAPDWQV